MRVPFKGGGDAVNSMLTGTTPIAIFGIGNLIQFIRSGKILGYRGRRRHALAARARHPDLPEIGYTDRITSSAVLRLYAPTGTPKRDHRQVHARRSSRSRSNDPEFQKQHHAARGSTPVLNLAGAVRQGARPADRAEVGSARDQGRPASIPTREARLRPMKTGQCHMKIPAVLVARGRLAAAARRAGARAQDWPTRPVKAITTTSAGGL